MSRYLRILIFNVIVCGQIANSQSIVRSSLSCLGSTVISDGLVVRQTVGQSSNTLVFNNGVFELRQGFQQPIASFLSIKKIPPIDFSLSPNPASDRTLLEFNQEYSQYTITIRNIYGLKVAEIKDGSSQSKWLEFKNYKPGIYIITVTSGNQKASKKIILTH